MIEVKGIKEINSKLRKIRSSVDSNINLALTNSARILRDQAIENVRNWSDAPGLSKIGSLIDPDTSWVIDSAINTEVTLTCISDHAAVVEFGGEQTGRTIIGPPERRGGSKGYPVGKQQHGGAIVSEYDGKPIIRQSVLIQQPMAYLREAEHMASDKILHSIKRDLWSAIEGNL
jgi:hypothetical protein